MTYAKHCGKELARKLMIEIEHEEAIKQSLKEFCKKLSYAKELYD